MNPFDLRGPEFLLFYFIFAAAVLGLLYYSRAFGGHDGGAKPPIEDPYLIAFLRGGASEALRVTTLSLMDRGLLTIRSSGSSAPFSPGAENRLEVTDPQAIDSARRPIEKQVLEAFQEPKGINVALQSLENCFACREYAANLERLGLLRLQESRIGLAMPNIVAMVVLAGVAFLKIVIAISRGHTNTLFLILLAIFATYLATKIGSPIRTERGEKFLQDVRTLFANLQLRASMLRPGGATADLAWLAAAYGLSEVPLTVFPHAAALQRPAFWSGWQSGSGSSGAPGHSGGFFSSCGSSSCGSGCGGGGCGGGCGGCGS